MSWGVRLGVKNSDGGAAWAGQTTRRRDAKIKVAARAGLVATAVGTCGPERQAKRVFELHGGTDGVGAAMEIADAE